MQTFIAYDGLEYPVRDGFNIWPEGWSAEEEARMLAAWRAEEPRDPRVDYETMTLIERSPEVLEHYRRAFEAWATGGLLNDRERMLLDAWTNRKNINKALAWIAPWTYRDFGFETACQVHGNSWEAECGCKFHIVIDHHLRPNYTTADRYPFRAVNVCEAHQRCNSVEAAFWTAARDCGEPAPDWPFLPVISTPGELESRIAEREALEKRRA